MKMIRCTLNGTHFDFDRDSGVLMEMSRDGVGSIMKIREGDLAVGMIDAAWPVSYEYETMRAYPGGASHKCAPDIEYDDSHITLTFHALPQSFDAPEIEENLKGRVYARVEMKALEDGQSVSLRCVVKNNSHTPIKSIVFPNFDSLYPTGTRENARLTFMGGGLNPYTNTATWGRVRQNTQTVRSGMELSSCGFQTGPYVGRWYDWGSHKGGYSLYRRHWGWDREDSEKMGRADPLYIKYDVQYDQVRVGEVKEVNIDFGEEYDSGEYVLTTHKGPWVFGAEPYKKWLHQNAHRCIPRSKYASEMMAQGFLNFSNYPKDPRCAYTTYDQMPEVLKDGVQYGLKDVTAMEPFNFTLPVTEKCFYDNWGGLENWNRNVKLCNEAGVNVHAFVSWVTLWGETCDNYGITDRPGTWAVSEQMIPPFCNPYSRKWACMQIWEQDDERWLTDIRNGLRFLRDKAGCPGIQWDQYVLGNHSSTALHDVINEYRIETEKMYPGTVWGAESTLFFESEVENSDYAFGLGYDKTDRMDLRPFGYIVGFMRAQIDVGPNGELARKALMDNQYLGVQLNDPVKRVCRKISDAPELAAALTACHTIHEHYLPWFADSLMLGDCVLEEECTGARVTGHQKDKELLIFVLKENNDDVTLKLNPAPFIGGGRHSYVIRDEKCAVVSEGVLNADGILAVSGPADRLVIIEVR